jgi:hypothetical protein
MATVPSDASYRASHALRFSSVSLNEDVLTGRGDDAVHQVARLGDVTGNQTISGLDVSYLARASVGLDTGFDAFPLTDPVIVGDVTGNGRLSGLDASLLAQHAVGIEKVLGVIDFKPTVSGFEVQFSDTIDRDSLNLYDGNDSPTEVPDIHVVGQAVGPVAGTLLADALGHTLRFVATGGPLPPDAYATIDPVIASDFSGNGRLSDLGASLLAQQVVGSESEPPANSLDSTDSGIGTQLSSASDTTHVAHEFATLAVAPVSSAEFTSVRPFQKDGTDTRIHSKATRTVAGESRYATDVPEIGKADPSTHENTLPSKDLVPARIHRAPLRHNLRISAPQTYAFMVHQVGSASTFGQLFPLWRFQINDVDDPLLTEVIPQPSSNLLKWMAQVAENHDNRLRRPPNLDLSRIWTIFSEERSE